MRENWDAMTKSMSLPDSFRGKVAPDVSASQHGMHANDIMKGRRQVSFDDVKAFTQCLIECPEEVVIREFEALLRANHSADTLFGSLLVKSAHLLGLMWGDDLCSFGDVTLGLAVMHRLLHRFDDALLDEVECIAGNPLALITPMPGERHIFAASLLAAYFRAAQWRVHSGINETWQNIVDNPKDHYVDVVVLTVSNPNKISDAQKLIQQMRARSMTAELKIIVGGAPFAASRDLYGAIGADGTACDAMSALDLAKSLVSRESSLEL